VAYTTGMSFFVQPTLALPPKTKNTTKVSLFLVALFTLMAVAQLFSFEKFPDVFGLTLPGREASAHVYAALIVTLEVAAVPFLLSMRLSFAMRVVSMLAGWCVVTAWFIVTLWENITHAIPNTGLLGATASLPIGWWSVLFCMGLGILVVWTSWGLWPFRNLEAHK